MPLSHRKRRALGAETILDLYIRFKVFVNGYKLVFLETQHQN